MRLYPKLLLAVLTMMAFVSGFAQETTATISGNVSDSKGTPISGASVVVKHEPTGFSTGTQTNAKGIYVIPNLKPGGPYTITISFTGLKTETTENVNLNLGSNSDA